MTSASVLINGFGVLFVILNSFGLGLRLPVGSLLAQVITHRKVAVWLLVINFVIIPLLFIGYLLTIASSIPGEIKVGFCVAALSAGMPFAPILARLAKADASIATTMLVVLTAATIIALPLGLPLAIDAVDANLKTSAWDVAWPLLLFLLLPVVLGCAFRVWWPDLTPELARWDVRVAILCLLFNLNFTLVAYWSLFVHTWGTESYIAAVAGPFIGLGCGYLLVSGLRVKDVGIRHATEVTTAVRNIAPMLLMMIFPFRSDPLVTVSITILNSIGIVIVVLFVLMWRRAVAGVGDPRTNQPASLKQVVRKVRATGDESHSPAAECALMCRPSDGPVPISASSQARDRSASSNIGDPRAAQSQRRRPLMLVLLAKLESSDILSTMENESMEQSPDDPRAALAVANLARQRMAAGLRLPTGLHPVLAAAVAVQIGTAAYGVAAQTAAGLAVALAGGAVFLGVAALALNQFRRINGVRVDGLTSQIVLGSGATSTLVYVSAFVAATWAAFESRWWLVAVAAVAGGAGYAFGVHRWWHAYRDDPVAHAGGASPRIIAALAVVASLGFIALLVAG